MSSIMPGCGLRQSQLFRRVRAEEHGVDAPALPSIAWFMKACTALTLAMSTRPRPMPAWLVATTTCQPAWFRRATASSAPGTGTHSSGDFDVVPRGIR